MSITDNNYDDDDDDDDCDDDGAVQQRHISQFFPIVKFSKGWSKCTSQFLSCEISDIRLRGGGREEGGRSASWKTRSPIKLRKGYQHFITLS